MIEVKEDLEETEPHHAVGACDSSGNWPEHVLPPRQDEDGDKSVAIEESRRG